MLAATLSLALTCLPGPFEERVVTSADFAFSLEVTKRGLRLTRDGATLWELARAPEEFAEQLVSDDGAWVAIVRSPTGNTSGAVVTLIDEKGHPREVRALSALTKDERDRLPLTSCGTVWLAAMRANGGTLELEVYLGGLPNPRREPRSMVTLRVDARTGAVTRAAVAEKKP